MYSNRTNTLPVVLYERHPCTKLSNLFGRLPITLVMGRWLSITVLTQPIICQGCIELLFYYLCIGRNNLPLVSVTVCSSMRAYLSAFARATFCCAQQSKCGEADRLAPVALLWHRLAAEFSCCARTYVFFAIQYYHIVLWNLYWLPMWRYCVDRLVAVFLCFAASCDYNQRDDSQQQHLFLHT